MTIPMKKIAYSLLVVLITVTLASAQNKQELKLDSFTKINFRAAGKLILRQGSPQKVEVEGSRDYIEELEIRVEGGKLVMGRDNWKGWNWNDRDDRITMYVTIPDIEAVSVSGSGDLVAENKITARDLDLKVSGSGSLEMEADASGGMSADVSGSGHIELKGKAHDFESHVSGSGRVKMEVDITEKVEFGISGSGKVYASGKAQEVKASISGSGEVLAERLVVDKCEIRISGSGGVEINVNKELDANISGSGSVRYSGNPSHVNSHASGSGHVRKLQFVSF
jgi:hypothetical protein